jgi:hypothetical protein
LSEEQAQRHPVARLQGIVTYADVGWKLLFLQDSTGGVRVEGDFPQTLKVGQLIKMTGIVVSGGKNPTVADPKSKCCQIRRAYRWPWQRPIGLIQRWHAAVSRYVA